MQNLKNNNFQCLTKNYFNKLNCDKSLIFQVFK